MGSLLPTEGVPPRYAQLYFFDTQNEIRNRMSALMEKETTKKVDENTVSGLIQMLDRSNALAQSFRMVKEWCRSHGSQDFSLRLISERTTSRQYNVLTMSEVAAMVVNDFGDGIPSRDIVVEISEMLAHIHGQKSHDRPEIGTRVFKMKLTELMDDLTKRHVYGDFVYVIEFQKQGLPHAHILLWLEERFKYTTPDEINDIIIAKIPSPTEDPDGYKVVSEFMLHGPCGKDAKYAPCTTEGKCSKHYPKVFLEETMIDEDGYPIYRCQNNKVTAKKGKFNYNNQHVVLYNWYLLLKYQAHINVEWCNRSKAIKYLFKYLNKGSDRATKENVTTGADGVSIQISQVDEINNYLNCRFIALCEAVWRLFSFDIHYSYPTVMQQNYHLLNQNAITLLDFEDLPTLLDKEGINIKMFTDWFELNKRDPAAKGA
ncbi:ATP-dependent DNA helicase PIF1 [Tanacetum coccineum]